MRCMEFKSGHIVKCTDSMILDFIGMSNTVGHFSEFCCERLKDVYQQEELAYKCVSLSEYFDGIAHFAKQYTHLDWED